ncbi:MAG TPA: PorV/PorQ family protein [Candidatus Eisenbacteria bacterium]|jgi:hypothetical protein
MSAHGHPPSCGIARPTTDWRWALLALAALAAALSTARPVAAQSKTGTTLGQFLMIEPSARLTALGNAGVAVEANLAGAYYNPAAVARVSRLELELSHVDWFAGIRHDYVALALPLGRWGTGMATVTSLNSGEIDVRTVSQPLGTGERYTVSDMAIGLGIGYPVSERFAAGLQIRFLQETVWHSTVSTATFDIGTIYRIRPDGLHIGASLANFGTEAGYSGRDLRITYDDDPARSGDNGALPGERFTQAYPVPVLFRVGLGLPWRPNEDWRLWTAAQAVHPSDNSESVSGGAEATYRDLVAVRIGYQDLFLPDSEEGLTLGTGLKGRHETLDYRLDYAWADHGRLGDTHRLTLGFSF